LEEGTMKSTTLEAFLFGVTLGIGMTLLVLATHKPGPLAASLETMAERGRQRKSREKEKRFRREKLKEVGFTDEEIEDIF
jgi:hypothetical protein